MRKPSDSVELRIDDNSALPHDCRCAAEKVATSPVAKSLAATGAAAPTDSHGSQESESNQMPYDSLQALSKRDLITLLRRKPCRFDDADLRCFTLATIQRLQVLRRRAREGKSVEEASEFARYVVASGLLKLCEGQAKVEVRSLAQDTLYDCDQFWRNQGQGPWVAKSELEAVNAKLDNLAGLVASLAHTGRVCATANPEPRLIVLPEVPGERGDTASREERAAAGRP